MRAVVVEGNCFDADCTAGVAVVFGAPVLDPAGSVQPDDASHVFVAHARSGNGLGVCEELLECRIGVGGKAEQVELIRSVTFHVPILAHNVLALGRTGLSMIPRVPSLGKVAV